MQNNLKYLKKFKYNPHTSDFHSNFFDLMHFFLKHNNISTAAQLFFLSLARNLFPTSGCVFSLTSLFLLPCLLSVFVLSYLPSHFMIHFNARLTSPTATLSSLLLLLLLFTCCFCPFREFFTHMKTSPMPLKSNKFTYILGTCDHYFSVPHLLWGIRLKGHLLGSVTLKPVAHNIWQQNSHIVRVPVSKTKICQSLDSNSNLLHARRTLYHL